MSSDYAIEVSGLSKAYQIYERPIDRLKQMIWRGRKTFYKDFWALQSIEFKIRKNQSIGIIGRNGSGKSTLLQLICGTLNQTAGVIKLNGKVAALLELGAGFNPEFTGVENIYMAASLYGLSRDQINDRFDSIVTFSDIGDHVHQPVKTYSSGMFVRLAFAVIANVDADILIIDEALAVGDAVFSQKCMRFIRKFRENGTLLFVSHDMGAVLNMCETAMWLHDGKIRQFGPSKDISEAYLQYTFQECYGQEAQLHSIENTSVAAATKTTPADKNSTKLNDYATEVRVTNNLSEANGWKTGAGEIIEVALSQVDDSSIPGEVFKGGELLKMSIEAIVLEDMDRPILGFLVRDRLGQDLFGENTLQIRNQNEFSVCAGDRIRANFVFRLPMLPNGNYSVMTSLANGDLQNHVQHHWLHNSLLLHVESSKVRYGLVGIEYQHMEFDKL